MTGHNLNCDQIKQARANNSKIPDERKSDLSTRQQPSDYGVLLRDNFDPCIPKPKVKNFERDSPD